jgi:3-hydroxyisobutyrate dehydrogenase-like beta-hydroxyacid dehydrogenase
MRAKSWPIRAIRYRASRGERIASSKADMPELISHDTHLGFIGLGYLGSRIARRLAAAGFPLIVYDRDPSKTNEFRELGAEIAPNAEALAENVDVVMSCLANEAAVEDVFLGAGKVLESARPGTRIIEMSTVSPQTSRRLHDIARRHGLSLLDVPISGSTSAAESGQLTLFGGGERQVFDSVAPAFEPIAKQWFYMGPSGSGAAMKLVVNTLLGVGMQAVAEAVALGSGLGLPRNLLLDTLAKTSVVAPAHVGKLMSAKSSDYSPQFPVRLMLKDFILILTAAAEVGLTMPAAEASAVIASDEASSGSEQDFSAVIRHMEMSVAAEKLLPPAA